MIEEELFNLLKQRVFPDLEKIDDTFSNADCFTSEYRFYIELKCRKTHYDELLIEYYKFRHLIHQARDKDMKPFYINSTPEGVWSFDLSKTSVRWEEKENLPTTTDFDNKEKVTKLVGFLPIREGVKLW